jgi:hypothetical protein
MHQRTRSFKVQIRHLHISSKPHHPANKLKMPSGEVSGFRLYGGCPYCEHCRIASGLPQQYQPLSRTESIGNLGSRVLDTTTTSQTFTEGLGLKEPAQAQLPYQLEVRPFVNWQPRQLHKCNHNVFPKHRVMLCSRIQQISELCKLCLACYARALTPPLIEREKWEEVWRRVLGFSSTRLRN